VIRKVIFPDKPLSERGFTLRGGEVQRIETFSDAVFAFAVTLLIVSLEVPKSFEELMVSIRGFFAFGICFTFLMLIWHEQHVFFRRYGLDDRYTIFLNAALLFIVLFYVYPLKFLFTLVFSNQIYGAAPNPFTIRQEQLPQLMIIYSIGYVTIYSIFLLLYLHARSKRLLLGLTRHELFDTNTRIYADMILIAVGLCSILLAIVLPARIAGLCGWVYMVIGPLFWIHHARRGVKRRKMG
jgi:uncharacterized membrane protein